MAIVKGQTFGVAEQITNTKLHNLVDLATFSNNFLTSLACASGKIPPQNLWDFKTVATNASLNDVSVGTIFKLWASTYCSIATFINARLGQAFTLMAGQASFPAILDAGSFLLSANWSPAKASDNITLVWDGTNFVEIGRVSV